MRVIVLRPGRAKPEVVAPLRPLLAPDGAPTSNLLMHQQTWPLVEVEVLASPGHRVRIEARHFDPTKHRKVAPAPATKRKVARERPTFSTEPKVELLTWTVARLRTLPEVTFVHRPSENKVELVDQILAIRSRP